MPALKRPILFWVLLAAGLVCCLVSLTRRAAAEHADRAVAVAISFSDVQTLAEAGGQGAEVWMQALSGAGARYLMGTEETETEARAAAEATNMAFARAGSTAMPGDAFLLHPLDARPISDRAMPAGDISVPLALVENETRTGVQLPADFDPDVWPGPMVKTLYLYDAYAAGDAEGIIFRAVTDRGMRLVVLTPLTENGAVVADPEAYTMLLSTLTERLAHRGLTIGGDFSCLAAPKRSAPLLAGMALLPVALLALFLRLLFPTMKPLYETLLLCAGTLAALGGAFLLPDLLQTLAALGTAALAGCWGALWLAYLALDGDTLCRRAALPLPARYLFALAELVLIALAGGLTVGALLADRAYLLEFRVFTGVKLAQALPLAFSAAILYIVLFRKNACAPARKPPKALLALLLLCAAAALVLVLLRSGDNAALTGALETRARDWLERVLYARPRTKEFLLAFPALALFVTARERSVPLLALPFGVLAEVGAVSVVNTFCHLFTPLRVSLARTLLGAGLGLVPALAAMALLDLLLRRENA